MTREATIKILAGRAASLLAQWAGLAGPAKYNNGDPSIRGGMCMALATLCDTSEAPPSDAQERLEKAIIDTIAAQDAETRRRGYRVDGLYFNVSVDYGPDHRLVELAALAGLENVQWPWKSSLSIGMVYSDGSGTEHVRDSRSGHRGEVRVGDADEVVEETGDAGVLVGGHGGHEDTYRLLPNNEGWLITRGFEIPTPVLDVCLAAAKSGHPAMTFEPMPEGGFTVPTAPAEPQPAFFDDSEMVDTSAID